MRGEERWRMASELWHRSRLIPSVFVLESVSRLPWPWWAGGGGQKPPFLFWCDWPCEVGLQWAVSLPHSPPPGRISSAASHCFLQSEAVGFQTWKAKGRKWRQAFLDINPRLEEWIYQLWSSFTLTLAWPSFTISFHSSARDLCLGKGSEQTKRGTLMESLRRLWFPPLLQEHCLSFLLQTTLCMSNSILYHIQRTRPLTTYTQRMS